MGVIATLFVVGVFDLSFFAAAQSPTAGSGSVTLTVTVTGGKYSINGIQQAQMDLDVGTTYIFNLDHQSNNYHPFQLSIGQDGTHGGGAPLAMVTKTAGYDQAFNSPQDRRLTFTPNEAGSIFYYCVAHANMGGELTVVGTDGGQDYDDGNNAGSAGSGTSNTGGVMSSSQSGDHLAHSGSSHNDYNDQQQEPEPEPEPEEEEEEGNNAGSVGSGTSNTSNTGSEIGSGDGPCMGSENVYQLPIAIANQNYNALSRACRSCISASPGVIDTNYHCGIPPALWGSLNGNSHTTGSDSISGGSGGSATLTGCCGNSLQSYLAEELHVTLTLAL